MVCWILINKIDALVKRLTIWINLTYSAFVSDSSIRCMRPEDNAHTKGPRIMKSQLTSQQFHYKIINAPIQWCCSMDVTEIKHIISLILIKSIHKQGDRMEHISICLTIEFQNASLLEFSRMNSNIVLSMG